MTLAATAADAKFVPGAVCNPSASEGLDAAWATYRCECYGSDGLLKWKDEARNIVTTAGKRLLLDVLFGATADPTWYVLLKGTGSAAAADTLASHAGWTELVPGTDYTGNRKAITFGGSSVFSTTGAQVTNGTPVAFAILTSVTIAGAGLSTVDTGTSGTLYSAGDFASSRTMGNGDTLNVTLIVQQNP